MFALTRDEIMRISQIVTSSDFHGACLKVDVHNSYKSKLFKKELDVNMAAERIVQLKESGVECSIYQHTINIRIGPRKEKGAKPDYGNFAGHHSICF